MTEAQRERYEERAAIIEYDGKVSRMIAEAMADQQERKLQEREHHDVEKAHL